MEFEDSCEEWRGGLEIINSSTIGIVNGSLKISRFCKGKIGIRAGFNIWAAIAANDQLQDLFVFAQENSSSFKEVLQRPISLLHQCKNNQVKFLKESLANIMEKSKTFELEKEKWLITKKKLEQLNELNKVSFADPLVERIHFWKSSLFPSIPIESFWDTIEDLESCLRLKILESELLFEQNSLKNQVNESKKKSRNLQKIKRNLVKKEEELLIYQSFLENECADIQKHWNEISKIADNIEGKEELIEIANKRTNSMSGFDNYFLETSLQDMNSSQIIMDSCLLESSNEANSEENEEIKKYSLNISKKLRKNAIQTIFTYFKLKKNAFLAKTFFLWKSKSLLKIKNKPAQKMCMSRRQVKYEQEKEHKKSKGIVLKLVKTVISCGKRENTLKTNIFFLKWRGIASKGAIVQRTARKNFSLPCKVLCFLSVLLSRSIADCKKMIFFRTWACVIKECNAELTKKSLKTMENRIHSNISQEKSRHLELSIKYSQLKSKLSYLETQVTILNLNPQ